MRRYTHCTLARERLHGYLDGELSEAETRDITIHLTHCERCREELTQLRALQAALRGVRIPGGASSARERVFARFQEAALPVSRTAEPQPERKPVRFHYWSRQSIVSHTLAVAAAMLIAFLTPVVPLKSNDVLPEVAEMSVLSQRHDHHVSHVVANRTGKMNQQPAVKGSLGNE